MRRQLLIGAGADHSRKVLIDYDGDWEELHTLDINPDHNPDFLWDLEKLPYPIDSNSFDEIHAYEVLEHIGKQGDWRFFFKQFSEFWRILKPNGVFCGTSPALSSPWLWGDPGHSRVISNECFVFLDQAEYIKQVGVTPMSDYRFVYKADFERLHSEVKQGTFVYALRAIKPSRSAQ
jgi:SAM-dependent methyltransferase